MTQGPGNRSYSSQRRANRGGRAKPTLVTATTNEDIDNDQSTQNGDALIAESDIAEEDQDALIVPPESAPAPSRKLPRFFSTVGRSEKAKEVSDEEAAQARIARATRGKTATKAAASATTSDEVQTATTKTTASKETAAAPARTRANAPARPPSPFKTKYIIGMVVYLLGAQLIGTFEQNFFVSNHMNSELAHFNLFGLPFVIYTSTLAFLATLIILLVVLAKFDFLPRSLSALGGQPAPRRGTTTSRSNSSNDVMRTPQPTMRQGVSGEDDDLYREYRENQRRTRKK
jgi:hypothetical protein